MKLNQKVKAKALDNEFKDSNLNNSKLSYFSRDRRVSNYIYSDSPFPTYIFEPDLLALEQKGNKDIDMYVEDIIERTQIAIDDANDDLKDIANRLVSKFETKRNSAELDLARDLYTIALKDGYNLGFSMILEFDDLFIDEITPEQREYLENNLRSNAEMMMKSIAKKNGFVLAEKESEEFKAEDLDMKAQDSADIQRNIEIDENIARWLINNNLEFDGSYIIFKLDGNDYTLTHRNETINFISDYDEYEGDPDELFDRIVNGDLREEFEKMLVGEDAFLELWV